MRKPGRRGDRSPERLRVAAYIRLRKRYGVTGTAAATEDVFGGALNTTREGACAPQTISFGRRFSGELRDRCRC